jgi:hypothetical protein
LANSAEFDEEAKQETAIVRNIIFFQLSSNKKYHRLALVIFAYASPLSRLRTDGLAFASFGSQVGSFNHSNSNFGGTLDEVHKK